MKRNTVLVVGILAAAGLEAVALLKGINGATLAASFTVIGSLVGFAFGRLGESPAVKPSARKFLALACAAGLGLGLGGCETVRKITRKVTVEVCIMDPTYGKICGSYKGGEFKITADVELPEALQGSIKKKLQELAGE